MNDTDIVQYALILILFVYVLARETTVAGLVERVRAIERVPAVSGSPVFPRGEKVQYADSYDLINRPPGSGARAGRSDPPR